MSANRFLIRSPLIPRHYRVWLTWVLCLCAWRGPLPIVHHHSLESQELAANLNLAVHAVHHHSHDIGHGHSGWHVHFVWPSSTAEDAAGDEDRPPPSLAGACVLESSRSASAQESMLAPLALGQLGVAAPLALTGLGSAAKPLPRPEIKSKRISPHASLCVARC